MKVERASEMDSLVWMRVKIWSTMPILAPSAGTKLPMRARNTIRPTCIEQEYYIVAGNSSQGKSTLLYPHYLCCIIVSHPLLIFLLDPFC